MNHKGENGILVPCIGTIQMMPQRSSEKLVKFTVVLMYLPYQKHQTFHDFLIWLNKYCFFIYIAISCFVLVYCYIIPSDYELNNMRIIWSNQDAEYSHQGNGRV
jgi:hypothetical protein